jgi:hypothetical protein
MIAFNFCFMIIFHQISFISPQFSFGGAVRATLFTNHLWTKDLECSPKTTLRNGIKKRLRHNIHRFFKRSLRQIERSSRFRISLQTIRYIFQVGI